MNRIVARNLSLILLLASFPVISIGTTGGQPGVWWAGLGLLALGGLIPPALRFAPEEDEEEEEPHEATDLGESCRVC